MPALGPMNDEWRTMKRTIGFWEADRFELDRKMASWLDGKQSAKESGGLFQVERGRKVESLPVQTTGLVEHDDRAPLGRLERDGNDTCESRSHNNCLPLCVSHTGCLPGYLAVWRSRLNKWPARPLVHFFTSNKQAVCVTWSLQNLCWRQLVAAD